MRKSIGLLSIAALALGGLSIGERYDGSNNMVPADFDSKKHESTKQGQKRWVVNGFNVWAATKKAAIKKAKKEYELTEITSVYQV